MTDKPMQFYTEYDFKRDYIEINKDFVHEVTRNEEVFCRLFRCGHHHKNYKPILPFSNKFTGLTS